MQDLLEISGNCLTGTSACVVCSEISNDIQYLFEISRNCLTGTAECVVNNFEPLIMPPQHEGILLRALARGCELLSSSNYVHKCSYQMGFVLLTYVLINAGRAPPPQYTGLHAW